MEKVKVQTIKADPWMLAKAFADKYQQGRDKDVGDVYAGILDIYDSVIDIYGTILPRIAKLEAPSKEDLLEEIVDLEMELKHIQDHARDAIRSLRHISNSLNTLTLAMPKTKRPKP